jgi:hypothetical protein
MPHDEDFLRRLDRVSPTWVEVALNLYRDHERVRYVLEHANSPERADRVAISLNDPRTGPFVVVARTGSFVTVLKEGMSPGPLPIITRAQLDAMSRTTRW